MMNSVYIIIFAAVLPAFLLVLYIWWKDKYEREPFSQIVKGVFYGVLSAGIAYFLEVGIQVFGLAPEQPYTFLQAAWKAFVGAAIPEEFAKLLMLLLLVRHNRHFNERFDGIVYACCVGMGFAATENLIYLFSNISEWESVAVSRAVFAVPGHFLFAVAMGYFYSMVYFGDISWRKRNRVFWVPVILHGTYDSLLFMVNLNTFLSGILLIVFYIFCWKMLKYGRKSIKDNIERDRQDPNQIAYWKDR